jgi:fatty-acyl-CoA synthase
MREGQFQLSGYVSLRDYGFHLPCYREADRGNSWYVALPEIPGDKLSRISAFEPYLSDDVTTLESREWRLVELGSQWHDVFTWTDRLLVGTRQDILSDLEAILPEIADCAPLTAFDLMFDMGMDDELLVSKLAAWLYESFSEPNATRCFTDTVLAPLARVRIFRALRSRWSSSPVPFASIQLSQIGIKRVRLQIREEVLNLLDEFGSTQTLVATLEKISASAGLTLIHSLDPAARSPVRTPTHDDHPRRMSDFQTLTEALEYGALGQRGLNFYDPRGSLVRAYSFRQLRDDALAAAYRLVAAGTKPGDRIAIVAETSPEFASIFFGAVYAGAWPVPLPLPTSFGGRDSYIGQLKVQLVSVDPSHLFYPQDLTAMAGAAAEAEGISHQSWESFASQSGPRTPLPKVKSEDIAYLQYSSGATRFPRSVAVTHRGLFSALAAYCEGIGLAEDDRCVSWLPWYHDQGLVGAFLGAVTNQLSADYIKTEDFARRPLSWLDLISRNHGTTISSSPSFGYDICARRVSSLTNVAERFDLSRWRIAGNGADMVRPDVMQAFVDSFAPAGFSFRSFCPSYGLAEATLAVTIMPPGEGIVVELVEEPTHWGDQRGGGKPERYRAIVNCGKPARDMEVEIRDQEGQQLGDREIGIVHCRGPSVMAGYFRDEQASVACLDDNGWLDTGDVGYLSDGYLYVVGRAKDMIVINGKSHWPEDIEWAVERLPGFKAGDIAAFSITTPGGEETTAVLVQCRTSDVDERAQLREIIRERVRAMTGMNAVVELVPPRTLPRTSSGKLSRSKARSLYLTGELQPYDVAA